MEDCTLKILLTNDDGIESSLLRQMAAWWVERGAEVFVVAPAGERSGVGHGFTYRRPLKVQPIQHWPCPVWSVDGLPADCVKLGVNSLLPSKPDLVISGPNAGANAGLAVVYSGTVAAAREALLWGIPGVSISLPTGSSDEVDLLRHWLDWAWKTNLWSHCTKDSFWNVNFPENFEPGELPKTVICRSGQTMYRDRYTHDARGWQLSGLKDPVDFVSGDDDTALAQSLITLVPHQIDTTSNAEIQRLTALLP